jgi:hypothetical protein
MKDINPTRRKVIGGLIQRGQSALELNKTKTTIAEYLRLSNSLLEQDSETKKRIPCIWVENESQKSEDLYSPSNQEPPDLIPLA